MTRTTIWPLMLTLTLTTAAFAATDEEKCQNKKLGALGKRDLCLQKERRKEVLGKTPDVAKCAEKLARAIAAAEKKAACRWLDNGDGTATDLNSGLQWELKTDDGSVHDKDNTYTWTAVLGAEVPDGSAFVDFLGTLNGAEAEQLPAGVPPTTTGCFAGKCDWRLPTIEELNGIVDLSAPGCGAGSPCTTIPGETIASAASWSSTTYTPTPVGGWTNFVFLGGTLLLENKIDDFAVRAVRGGP